MSKTLDKLFETLCIRSRQKTQLRLSDEKGLDISKRKILSLMGADARNSLAMELGSES